MKLYRAVVEDNNDPEKLGRVRVRIFGEHTEINENAGSDFEWVQYNHLPWAEVMGGTAFGLINGIGVSSVLRQGTWVWCILDHDNPNKPIIVGTIIGKVNPRGKYSGGQGFNDKDEVYPFDERNAESDLHRFVRNEKVGASYYDNPKAYGQTETIHKIINDNLDKQNGITDGFTGADVSQEEPESLNSSSEYPDVSVIETHSGHHIELDDTSGNERVRVYHTSGSYIEIRPDGTFVQKSANTDAESHYIHMSDVQEHIAKGVKRYIEDNLEEIIGQNFLQNVKGDLKLHVEGNVEWQIDGDITITSGGGQVVNNGGNYTHNAPRIDLNP